jgi:hypothetical protein
MQLKRYSTVRVLGLCLFAALVSSFPLRAQDVTASITGVVSDPTGAMVGAAKVTATRSGSRHDILRRHR